MFGSMLRLWRLWRQRVHDRRFAAQFSNRDLWDAAVLNADESQLQSPARLAAGGAGQVLVTPARRADRCD
jgi:hypothetical protein